MQGRKAEGHSLLGSMSPPSMCTLVWESPLKPAPHRPCLYYPESLSAWSAKLFHHEGSDCIKWHTGALGHSPAIQSQAPQPGAYHLSHHHPILSHRDLPDRAAAWAASAIKPVVRSPVGRELALQGGCTFSALARTTPIARRGLKLLSWLLQSPQTPLSKEVYIRKLHWWISCSWALRRRQEVRLMLGQDTHVRAAEAVSERCSPSFLRPRALPGAAGRRCAARLFDTCWSWGQMRNDLGRH